MSSRLADRPSSVNSAPARGRGMGRGRAGRARGRGRGSSSFHVASKAESVTGNGSGDGAKAPSVNGVASIPSARRTSFRKSPNARKSSTSVSSADAGIATITVATLEKELPPHIAGAAVDAESLVSRVKELAVNSHGHSSSMESRFSTHFDWADEEDDPDSLPDLNDWAIPSSKPIDAGRSQDKPREDIPPSVDTTQVGSEPASLPEETSHHNFSTPSDHEEVNTVVTLDGAGQQRYVSMASSPPPTASSLSSKPNRRQGLEASIWASSPPPPVSQPNPRPQRGRGHFRSASHRPPAHSNQSHRPTHFSRKSVANHSRSVSPPLDAKSSPRKPHTRPIISGAALASLSRTLDPKASHQKQSTPI